MGDLYSQYEYWFAASQLVLAMLGMGATLTTTDFKQVLIEPRAVTIGSLSQLVLVPVIAFLFISVSGAIGGVVVGIALIAAIPGGTTSNIFTYMARGNVPLSISITGVTTLACLVSTPLILGMLITDYLPANFAMPTVQIVTEIALTLLLPLVIGMVILKWSPKNASWISTWSIRLSLFGVLMIVIGSASAGRLDLDAFGNHNLLLVCAFIIVLCIVSWLTTKLFSVSQTDSTAIKMEVVVRNINLGVLIKASMFPAVVGVDDTLGNTVLFTILLYGGLQMLLAAVLIFTGRRGA